MLADKYDVDVDVDTGTDAEGNVIDKSADLYTCVYDVRNPETVNFLKTRVLPKVKELNQPMAVVGLGLEYRTGGGQDAVDIRTAQQLGSQYGCRGTEVVSCQGVS